MESLYPSKVKESNSSATKPSPTPEDLLITPTQTAQAAAINKKSQKRKRKAVCLKNNQNTKNRALKVLSRHCNYLEQMDMYNEVNFKPSMPTTPSY